MLTTKVKFKSQGRRGVPSFISAVGAGCLVCAFALYFQVVDIRWRHQNDTHHQREKTSQ